MSGLPVLDEAGRVCGYRGAARDITALKRSVAELRESEDRLRTVMDSVLDGIVLIDDAGRIELCNRSVARLFGRPVEEMVGQPVETLMPEPHRSRHHEYLRRYLETGEGRVIGVGGRELEGLRADGSRFPLELAVGELRLDDALKFVGVIRDLTERKHAERELELARSQLSHREKMAAIGQLAAGIVHEVGNPVAAISGAIEVLLAQRARGGEDRAARELEEANLRLIEAQVHRLAGIGREIAEFAGPQPSERQLVDVNQLARSAVALLRYDPRVRSVQLEVRLDPAVPAIRGSADQLTQVLLNLLLNAADACEGLPSARTHVLLATAPDRDGVVIEVRDTGAGMDSETLARAFDAFYTTKSGGRGMGLGLSMCHRIVEHHGGTCSLRSVAGEGTTVRIHLPGDFDPPEGVAT